MAKRTSPSQVNNNKVQVDSSVETEAKVKASSSKNSSSAVGPVKLPIHTGTSMMHKPEWFSAPIYASLSIESPSPRSTYYFEYSMGLPFQSPQYEPRATDGSELHEFVDYLRRVLRNFVALRNLIPNQVMIKSGLRKRTVHVDFFTPDGEYPSNEFRVGFDEALKRYADMVLVASRSRYRLPDDVVVAVSSRYVVGILSPNMPHWDEVCQLRIDDVPSDVVHWYENTRPCYPSVEPVKRLDHDLARLMTPLSGSLIYKPGVGLTLKGMVSIVTASSIYPSSVALDTGLWIRAGNGHETSSRLEDMVNFMYDRARNTTRFSMNESSEGAGDRIMSHLGRYVCAGYHIGSMMNYIGNNQQYKQYGVSQPSAKSKRRDGSGLENGYAGYSIKFKYGMDTLKLNVGERSQVGKFKDSHSIQSPYLLNDLEVKTSVSVIYG